MSRCCCILQSDDAHNIYSQQCANILLKDKKILMFGDSNLRALYKDILWLCKKRSLISNAGLRQKLEKNFLGDTLKSTGILHSGRNYEEIRLYLDLNLHIEFHFMTRCFNEDFKKTLWNIKNKYSCQPDVIIISSCVWDLTRWGFRGTEDYKTNVIRSMKAIQWCLPHTTKIIWLTSLPPSFEATGGFLVEKIKFLRSYLRWHITEANQFVYECAKYFNQNVIDLHYYMQFQLHKRTKDGIHWEPKAVRFLTNLLLTHFKEMWSYTHNPCNHLVTTLKSNSKQTPNKKNRKRKNKNLNTNSAKKKLRYDNNNK